MDTRDALLHRVTRATPDAFTHGQNQKDILAMSS